MGLTIDLFKKHLGKQTLIFPQVIKDSEFLKRCDTALGNRSPYVLSILFRIQANNPEVKKFQNMLNFALSQKRKLSKDDTELVSKISSAYTSSEKKGVIFNSVGNMVYIERLAYKLKKKRLPKIIRLTCFLWLYQNMVELILAHLSELFYFIAGERKDKDFIKEYEKKAKKEEHLEFGRLREYAVNWGFTARDKKTFLHNSEIRNRLAHANSFYDEARKEFVLSNQKVLTLPQFNKEFIAVKNFLYELLFQLNDKKPIDISKELLRISREYQKMSRSPIMSRIFKWLKL